MAILDQRLLRFRYNVQSKVERHSRVVVVAALGLAVILSFLLAPVIQKSTGDYFNPERFAALRSLLATIGGALVGATAIGFSIVMIAVQLNFARMPHGLFRRLSADPRLLSAFASTFILAIVISALSIVPDSSWAIVALVAASWGTLLILILFLYGYWRALDLINPAVQLRLLVDDARTDLKRWARRAERMAPLVNFSGKDGSEDSRSTHDLPRLAFFRANPQWTVTARRAVAHAISFARRYAEQDDFAVSARALEAVVLVNASYVAAKGKTFFQANPIIEIPEATDAFINDTLEHLRRLSRVSIGRGDEEGTRQILTTFGGLVQTYLTIDYAATGFDTKQHAQLAASYLTDAVEQVFPRNLPDLAMEGLRLMGTAARSILVAGDPNETTTLVDKIAIFSVVGAVKQQYRPVTLTGMEQFAKITFDLLRTPERDIGFAASQLRNSVELVVRAFLEVPDTALENAHGAYLAPYYSLTKSNTLGEQLTSLCDAVIAAKEDDEAAEAVLRNFETWSEELYRTEKTLLLLAIEKRSHFTFDSLHWIQRLTMLLVALSKAPAANDYVAEELEKHAVGLISVISWIPEDIGAIQFVETFSIPELLFGTALDAIQRESHPVLERCRELLMGWGFKAAAHTSRGSLERTMLALVTLALWKEDLGLDTWLKGAIGARLKTSSLGQELLDRAARGLRRDAASLRRREFEVDRIRHAINQLDRLKVRVLLKEVADLLSPNTAGEKVGSEPF
ncbi:DUF2254 domain-containing protein [Bradyrhizobium sp. BTAi1]|uniref:DUF2254 domain-containing protein n=1 Tax=Bradyrhizobium sp. (strain BTAi1 / ATCC BAA-1182) TaxID=288000 RepID=UPI0011D13FC0|nr:DUF2254 domain-containing protein [Bradyrhizobium sp. BTAi1]